MPTSTYKALVLPTQGVTTTWGDALNNMPFADIDSILGGITTKTLTNTNVNLTAAESKTAIVRLIGTLTGNVRVTTVCQGFTMVENLTSGSFTVSFTNSATYGGGAVGTPVTVPQGGRYVVVSDTTNGSRLMLPATSATASTVGMIADFIGNHAPTGWLKANGGLYSRSTYAGLWSYANSCGVIVTDAEFYSYSMYGAFSTGNGSTTFRVPDLRGFFRRSWADDATGSQDYGRSAGSYQDQLIQAHTHAGTTGGQSADHNHSIIGTYTGGGSAASSQYFNNNNPDVRSSGASNDHTHNFTTASTGGSQTRPQNIALMTCISYV
jgi:microcystin-dependent protein